MLLLATLLACGDDATSSDSGADSGTPGFTLVGPDLVEVSDDSDGLHFAITGGNASSWELGVFFDAVGRHEEDCLTAGSICHTLGPTGGSLTWDGDCDAPEDGKTCIAQLYYRQGQVTYMIRSGDSCWAWGDDASVYGDALGCTITDWDPDA